MSVIDVTRLPRPAAIPDVEIAATFARFVARYLDEWTALRARDPSLPMFDVETLRSDPTIVLARTYAYVAALDLQALNDAVSALIPHLSSGSNLDMLAATRGLARLQLAPANGALAAVMEADAALLARYLESFERESAGSAALYRRIARTVWPQLLDVAVVGRAVHGRRGDVDVVLLGPGGRAPTQAEILLVRNGLRAPGVAPEATAVTVVAARVVEYDAALHLTIPAGPDPALVAAEVDTRVRTLAAQRLRIGAEMPRNALAGAAYGASVDVARIDAPVADVPADPYAAPRLRTLTITWEART